VQLLFGQRIPGEDPPGRPRHEKGPKVGPNIIIASTFFNILSDYAFARRGAGPVQTGAPVDFSL
jgi:hypothetical protein